MTTDTLFGSATDDTPMERAISAGLRAYRLNATGVNEFALRAALDAAINVLARQDRPGPAVKGSPTSMSASLMNAPRTGTQRWRILEVIRAAGTEGQTRDELVYRLGMPNAIRPRCLELLRAGFIARTGRVRSTRSGNEAEVLVAVEFMPRPS